MVRRMTTGAYGMVTGMVLLMKVLLTTFVSLCSSSCFENDLFCCVAMEECAVYRASKNAANY
eukprot:scaffold4420_cov187-Amphora_coffeaeformis.AAC.22